MIVVSGCNAQITNVKEYLENEYNSLNLLYFQKGNFTNTGNDEYISFYQDPSMLPRELIGKNEPPDISKVVIFCIKNGYAIKKYEIPNFRSSNYNAYPLEIIKKLNINNLKWNGYCYIGDFNNNLHDEAILFALSGIFFSVAIYEFHSGTFQEVLEYPSNTPLSKIEAKDDGNRKEFVIYDEGEPYAEDGKRNWYLMRWSDINKKYLVVEKGVEQWLNPKTGELINE